LAQNHTAKHTVQNTADALTNKLRMTICLVIRPVRSTGSAVHEGQLFAHSTKSSRARKSWRR
jgi:hypothetical protein